MNDWLEWLNTPFALWKMMVASVFSTLVGIAATATVFIVDDYKRRKECIDSSQSTPEKDDFLPLE